MRILGLDPSLNATGYGVVECHGSAMHLIEGGVIVPARSTDLSLRLAELQRGLADVILSLRPEVMVIEEVFSQTAYPRTAIMMAHARGALVCTAALKGMPVFNYSATAVKRALVGNGLASKDQVAAMVVQVLRLRRRPSPADVTDALALAIAHARRSLRPSNGAVEAARSRRGRR
ncbi:MAG: crossover junction endodeoxyribonuclease RuvC [Candidatus Eremiobacteraeota bacterium]|nr:crossover junction endodeoxyribonuclease RuvC [Candidatus Eremiobacteraeota bacterium]